MLTQRVDEPHDVARGMLSIRVRGDDALQLRPRQQRRVDARLERAALAQIDCVHGHARAQLTALPKNRRVGLLPAVVHQHDLQPLSTQLARERDEPLVRLVGGYEYDDACGSLFIHPVSPGGTTPACRILLIAARRVHCTQQSPSCKWVQQCTVYSGYGKKSINPSFFARLPPPPCAGRRFVLQ